MPRLLKILGYTAVGLATVVAGAAAFVYVSSNGKMTQTFSVTPRSVAILTDATALARGKHLAETRGCNECHGKDFAGNKVIEDGAMGKVYAPNLTRGKGSRAAAFKDEDWVRAIRHGVGPDGHGLFIMPSEEYQHFSDPDLGALIGYLKSVPPVDRERVGIELGPVSRVLLAANKIKLPAATIDHPNVRPVAVATGVTVEYGRYVAAGCIGCHGPNFSGGKIEVGPPSWPEAANLTPHESGRLAKWSEADFLNVIRNGKRPDGTDVNPVMPRVFGQMDDTELKAIWAYFRTLPPVATGVR